MSSLVSAVQREVSESAFEYLLSEILNMKVPTELVTEQFVSNALCTTPFSLSSIQC